VYAFFVTYANLDGWTPTDSANVQFSVMDRWILSRSLQTIDQVTHALEVFEPDRAAKVIGNFLDDLSNWYLRRSRRRFWAKTGVNKASDADKHAAYTALYRALLTLIHVLAPFTPFVVETIYQNLVRSIDDEALESIHHRSWPEVDPAEVEEDLLREMKFVQMLVSMGHAARNKANRKLRQPLSEVAFAVASSEERMIVDRYDALIRDELNVKKVRLLDAAAEAVEYQLKALPKQLGQKYGSLFPAIRDAVGKLDQPKSASALLAGEPVEVKIEGQVIQLTADEVEIRIEAHEGFSAVAEGPYVAALVTELTEELALEGLAREFVRRVQDLRRQADLQVDDGIEVQYAASDKLTEAIDVHRGYIQGEVIAERMQPSADPQGEITTEHHFDGESLQIALRKVEG
jgi:isoleucyl-tRNA synthetase